jgi:hypothetical protein
MKPSYMAIKKAFYGRQPGSIFFFSFVLLLLKESNFICVFFLCPCYRKKVFFSVSTIAKIKCQVLPILDVIRLQYLFGVAEICTALLVHDLSYISITPMDL